LMEINAWQSLITSVRTALPKNTGAIKKEITDSGHSLASFF